MNNDLIVIENENLIKLNEKFLKNLLKEKELKRKVDTRLDDMMSKLLEEMERKNIKKIDTPEILINYIEAIDKETFDKGKLKEEHPELYDDYVKFSPVKSSLRVKVK